MLALHFLGFGDLAIFRNIDQLSIGQLLGSVCYSHYYTGIMGLGEKITEVKCHFQCLKGVCTTGIFHVCVDLEQLLSFSAISLFPRPFCSAAGRQEEGRGKDGRAGTIELFRAEEYQSQHLIILCGACVPHSNCLALEHI